MPESQTHPIPVLGSRQSPGREATAWPRAERLLLLLLSVYGGVVVAVLLLAPTRFLPAEDAVILHQYSRNLAEHGSITYFAGGPRAEGATDFGWMLLVAGALRMGIPAMVTTAVVNAASLLLLAVTLLRIGNLRASARRVLALAGAAGLFPQILAAVSGFAVLPEMLALALLVRVVLFGVVPVGVVPAGVVPAAAVPVRLMPVSVVPVRRVMLAALLALVLCLLRPDGVVFAVPLLFAMLRMRGEGTRSAAAIAGVFLLPGILYFCLRARYFGELFPLPFLVKADVHRRLGLVVPHSVRQSLKYIFFDAAVLLPLSLRKPRRSAMLLPLLFSLLVVPTVFYWGMRLDQNVADRFFSYLPVGAALVIAFAWPAIADGRRILLLRVGVAAFLLLMLGPLLREVRSFRDAQFRSVQAVARGLGRAPVRGTMLTSEAGFLAYESGWIAVDPWGLNTPSFARRFIQPADVAALHPDLVVLHPDLPGDCVPAGAWPSAYPGRAWEHMIRNVALGASNAGTYDLWYLPYGSAFYQHRRHWGPGEGDQECFFLDRRSPLHDFMAGLLRQHGGTPVPPRP